MVELKQTESSPLNDATFETNIVKELQEVALEPAQTQDVPVAP